MKAMHIALKDIRIRFLDRNALVMMLIAPLALSAIIGAAFGGFSGGEPPFRDIPVAFVNADEGELGAIFVEVLTSPDLADLLEPAEVANLEAAIAMVERGEARAAVYIPPGFTRKLQDFSAGQAPLEIELYTDPTANVSPEIVRGILEEVAGRLGAAVLSGQVAADQMLTYGDTLGPALADLEPVLQQELEQRFGLDAGQQRVALEEQILEGPSGAGVLDFFAPSMAIFFLAFTMFDGTRSILTERREGTLSRLSSTPTPPTTVLAGKIGGVFLSGVLQFTLLVLASSIIFGLDWGRSPAGLSLMVLAVVSAYASLGALVAAFARDLSQAGILGTAITLIFAALGGNFFPATSFPDWLQPLSHLSINRWGLNGLSDLTIRELGLVDVLPEAGVLLALAAILLLAASWRFSKIDLGAVQTGQIVRRL